MTGDCPSETDFELLRSVVMAHEGWDLLSYRPHQLFRRLRVVMLKAGASGFAEYATMLRRQPERLGDLRASLGVKVTHFFRNPERFRFLREEVLPSLPRRNLRIWCAGCANGAEAYSLAMLFDDVMPGGFSIQATDMDDRILRVAGDGWYPERDTTLVPGEWRKRYLVPSGTGFTVRPEIRALVFFRAHNLLSDPFPQGQDLIACRNVLIYLSDAAKTRIVNGINAALKPGGVLFLGSTESILNPTASGFASCGPFFYRKTSQA